MAISKTGIPFETIDWSMPSNVINPIAQITLISTELSGKITPRFVLKLK